MQRVRCLLLTLPSSAGAAPAGPSVRLVSAPPEVLLPFKSLAVVGLLWSGDALQRLASPLYPSSYGLPTMRGDYLLVLHI